MKLKKDDLLIISKMTSFLELDEEKGGEGSGNFGHEGVPGQRGGSAGGGGGGGGFISGEAAYDRLNSNEKDALQNYTGDSSSINYQLRNGEVASHSQKTVEAMDSAFDKQPELPTSNKVYRYEDPQYTEGLKVGDTYTDKGFVSTTRDRGVIQGMREDAGMEDDPAVYIHIEVPAGEKVLPADYPGGYFKRQKEVILPRGRTYKVTGRDGDTLNVEMLP